MSSKLYWHRPYKLGLGRSWPCSLDSEGSYIFIFISILCPQFGNHLDSEYLGLQPDHVLPFLISFTLLSPYSQKNTALGKKWWMNKLRCTYYSFELLKYKCFGFLGYPFGGCMESFFLKLLPSRPRHYMSCLGIWVMEMEVNFLANSFTFSSYNLILSSFTWYWSKN